MKPLWTRDEAAAAISAKISGPDWQASGISIDSRTLTPGELFVALVGPSHDGHDHVANAFRAGAVAASKLSWIPLAPSAERSPTSRSGSAISASS